MYYKYNIYYIYVDKCRSLIFLIGRIQNLSMYAIPKKSVF